MTGPGERRLRFVARLAAIMDESPGGPPRRKAVAKAAPSDPPVVRRTKPSRTKK